MAAAHEVVVIGGGIVASSAAYRLARAGARVTLVDRADAGHATAAGAGIISPGTSARSGGPVFALAAASVAFYPELLAQLAADGELATGFETVGGLFIALNDQESERLPAVMRQAVERAATTSGIGEVTPVDARQARELFPALAEIAAGFHVAGAARVNGRLIRQALQQAAVKRGTRLLLGDARPLRQAKRVVGVEVDGERIPADVIVLAAGAWTRALGEMLGLSIPVFPQRGQILHLDMPAADTSHWPIVMGFHSHYLLTFPEHRVVAGATRESEAGYDYRMTAGGVREALSEALRVAPGLAPATLAEVRVGFRPASPDQLPILGRAPGLENVFVATGHGANGLQLGPYSGAAVADLVLGAPVGVDLAPFTPARFAG